MTTIVLNVSSLVLGLTAWGFGLGALVKRRMSLMSFALCLLALVLQFSELTHRAVIGDVSAILDTVWGVTLAAVTLAVGTLFLNTLAYLQSREGKAA